MGSNLLGAVVIAVGLAVGPAGPAAAEESVLLAFGDSLTQGYGLPEEDGFVPVLEDWLQAEGADVRVINGGVSGDTTAGGLARIDWTLTDEVDAVLVALGGNDLLRGLDPAEARANLGGILEAIGEKGLPVLLAGLPGPGNYGAEYRGAVDALYPELAAEYGVEFYPNFLSGLGDGNDLGSGSVRDFLQDDGIHPNAEGVQRIVEAIGPAVLDLVETAQAREAAEG